MGRRSLASSSRRQKERGRAVQVTVSEDPSGRLVTCHVQSVYDGLPLSGKDLCSKRFVAWSTRTARERVGQLIPIACICTAHSSPTVSGRGGRSMTRWSLSFHFGSW